MTTSQSSQLSSDQLRQALQLSEQIDTLERRLNSILGGSSATTSSKAKRGGNGGSPLKGRKLSPATLRKMRAAQQARWAKVKGDKGSSAGGAARPAAASTQKKQGGGMTPEQRAKISATLKARWAAKKKG